MNKKTFAAAFAGALIAAIAAPQSASAQTMPDGSELRGAVVRVEMADGVTNTVNFHPDGTATIESQTGLTRVQGRWFVQGQQLCLELADGRRECWAYNAPFQTGQQVVLTSDCPATSRWTALSTAPMAPPIQAPDPERG